MVDARRGASRQGRRTQKSSPSVEDGLLNGENQECGDRAVCDREPQPRPSNEAVWGGITLKIPIPEKGNSSSAALPDHYSHAQRIATPIHFFVCAMKRDRIATSLRSTHNLHTPLCIVKKNLGGVQVGIRGTNDTKRCMPYYWLRGPLHHPKTDTKKWHLLS